MLSIDSQIGWVVWSAVEQLLKVIWLVLSLERLYLASSIQIPCEVDLSCFDLLTGVAVRAFRKHKRSMEELWDWLHRHWPWTPVALVCVYSQWYTASPRFVPHSLDMRQRFSKANLKDAAVQLHYTMWRDIKRWYECNHIIDLIHTYR